MRISDWSSDVCSSDLGGYVGPKLRAALDKIGRWTLHIVKRSDAAKGFEVLPRRWVVARTFALLGSYRRLAMDGEQTVESAATSLLFAHISRVPRLLASTCYNTTPLTTTTNTHHLGENSKKR